MTDFDSEGLRTPLRGLALLIKQSNVTRGIYYGVRRLLGQKYSSFPQFIKY